jgi:integrase
LYSLQQLETALKVQSLKAVGKYSDGLGLYLLIPRPGEKFWTFRYMRAGRARQLGLGPLHSVSLVQARARALEARQLLLDGKDPIEMKHAALQAQRVELLRTTTFAQAAEQFMQTDAIQRLASDKHRKQWRTTISEACKTIGALPLEAIDSAIMLKTLLPVWQRAPETGSRLRGRLERVFAWALAHKLYAGTNPAALEVLRDALPAKPKAKHHAAMPYASVPAFMAELRSRDSVSARALEFTILTAVRTSETIGATWAEIDLEAGVWCIPAQRMKAKKEHRVPLSDRALEILRGLSKVRPSDFVFINGGGRPLSNMALLELLKGMAPGVTTHGFRSSFSDWCRDRTAWPRDVVEMALAHTIKDKSERAYRRGDALEKRARLMQQWCDYLEAPAGVVGNVVSSRA